MFLIRIVYFGFQTVETRGLRKQGSQISSRTSSVVSLDPLVLSLDGSDPLSHFAKIDSFEIDPLTKLANEYVRGIYRVPFMKS